MKRIFDIVGWVGAGLVFAGVAVRFVRPEQDRVWRGLAIAGLVCVVAYILSQWRDIASAFSRRQTQYGAAATASVLVGLGILVGVNYVSSRQNKRWDLTAAKQFSLSDQSTNVLKGLTEPVKVLVFERQNQFDRFRDRLNEFTYASKQVAVEYIDPDKNPARAKAHQIQAYGTVVFEHKGRTEKVVGDSEQDLTNGLKKVVTGEQKKIYFTQGHGEKDTVSSDRAGYSAIVGALSRENLAADKVVLAQVQEAPADALAIVVAGPKTDFLQPEVELLRTYLRKGGKALIMLDPPDKPEAVYPLLEGLLKEWGIQVDNDVVVDASGMGRLLGTDASVPVAASYPPHAITQGFGVLTAYPLARSVTPIAGGVDGRTAQTFVETGKQSWAEKDVEALRKTGEVSLDASKGDKEGPISIGVAVSGPAPDAPKEEKKDDKPEAAKETPPTPETRLVAMGDSDFASNFAANIQGNADLFLNIVSWLAKQESMIGVRPKDAEDRRITLTADQQTRLFWFSIILLPGAVLGSGVYSWWRRR